MWLLYISSAWVAGVFSGSKAGFPFVAIFSGFLPFLLIPFLPGSKKKLIIVGLCLLTFFGGTLRFPSSQTQIDEHSLCFYNDEGAVEIQGMVADKPDVRAKCCFLRFSASEINMGGTRKEISGTTLMRVPRYPAYCYGDVLQVIGELKTPAPFDDFDYRSYLAQQGIYSIIYYPQIEVLDTGKGAVVQVIAFNTLQIRWLVPF